MTAATAFDAVAIGTEIQRRVGVKTSRDEPLARFTTMRVGGPADLFATVHNPFELRALVRFARQRGIPHLVLGRGSDLVISDRGIRGLVIQDRAEGSRVEADRYVADAGVPMARAATETQKAGLTGLEFGLAIPGTVGGAVWANAGAHDADVGEQVLSIFREDGIDVLLGASVRRVEGLSGQSVRVQLQTPAGERTVEGSDLLAALGRTPNTEELNLPAADVETDGRGSIKVNDRLETTAAGVWALGDVNGGPQFTHASLDDWRIVTTNLAGGGPEYRRPGHSLHPVH